MESETNQSKVIRPSVKVIFRNGGKIMLIKLENGILDIPGGGIEHGESNMEALRRELEEEIGFRELDEKKLKLFHSWHYISRSKKRHSVYIAYLYDMDVIPSFQNKEVVDITWMTKDDVSRMEHVPEFKDMLLMSFDFCS